MQHTLERRVIHKHFASITISNNLLLLTVSIYIGTTSVGCLLSGVIMHLWGRKLTVQIAVSCACIGWLLIAITSTYPLMLLGRALGGFGKGICTPAVTVSQEPMHSNHLLIVGHDGENVKERQYVTFP
jgi:MFS family permease